MDVNLNEPGVLETANVISCPLLLAPVTAILPPSPPTKTEVAIEEDSCVPVLTDGVTVTFDTDSSAASTLALE